MQALWGPVMGEAVMLRKLAKDEEVTLLGSQLFQGLWDLFLFTTLNLISSTISPFISFFSSCLIMSEVLVPGSLMPHPQFLKLCSWFYFFQPIF